MDNNNAEDSFLRKTLSLNIKKQRKILGLTQEKLAEAANLSSQTINDIEGCRMWVSDKTMNKLAKVFHVEAYQLFVPGQQSRPGAAGAAGAAGASGVAGASGASGALGAAAVEELLADLEGRVIRTVRHQFECLRMSGHAHS